MSHKKLDQFDYVRNTYGLNVGVGTRVTVGGKRGTVVGATHHIIVLVDGERRPGRWHASDVKVTP